jgi:hypothetical protein
MKRYGGAVLVLVLTALPLQAHFIWILPDPTDRARASVVFSDDLQPDKKVPVSKIAGTSLFVRDTDGKTSPLKWEEGKTAYELTLPEKGPRGVGAVCLYGVYQHGKEKPALLHYYAKTLLGMSKGISAPETSLLREGWKSLDLDLVLAKDNRRVQVLWQGKPLPDAEVVLLVPGVDKAVMRKTNEQGEVALDAARSAGLYGIRANHIKDQAGEHDGKKYSVVRYLATLVLRCAAEDLPGEKAPAADPEATKLLADARTARAQWTNFPGFRADLEVNIDGKVCKGTVEVSSKGKVVVTLDEDAAAKWARGILASTVAHRLDNSAALDTPCAFADSIAHHPLGRAIRVLNDEFHSSYRVRNRQIIVVNRQMKDVRFTITVMHNNQNKEKKYLPSDFVVNTWDLKTNALRSSETHHQSWKRVETFDLPGTTTVVTATAGQLEARSLKLSNHKLTPAVGGTP